MRLEIVGIIVITSHNASRGHNIPVGVHDGQDIAGLAFLATLVGYGFTAFLG